jgi:excisionase family DNA binding protein
VTSTRVTFVGGGSVLHSPTVAELIRTKQLAFIKVGRRRLIIKQHLDAFIESKPTD